ncbi:MAG: fumarate hydratase [Spirochaetaceae bacterium]|jgi:fumarate hydratase subunit alpha|nr:fumarate hydratase [Spirochaetaceae bacterium]
MRVIEASVLRNTVKRLCMKASRDLPRAVEDRIRFCRTEETWPPARDLLDQIIANFELARRRGMPICQDTGMAWVFLEIGTELYLQGDINAAVNEGVREGYREGCLRASMVGDPLKRVNTGDNTPAMITCEFVPGDRLTVTVAPKGFGSENMSQIKMLRPSDGAGGVIDFVLSVVEEAGPNPCPPIIVGVGIGGSFDKAALIAKKALLRTPGAGNGDPFYANLEAELLERINALGIGPQGFGGRTTALSVAIETLPTHIAGLPCAVNINCHVARHARECL